MVAMTGGPSGVAEAPATVAEYRGLHRGETLVVCGCGRSLATFVEPERFVTIGVNDVGRLFQPDYLVVLNGRRQFRGDRFRYVEESRAKAIFTQLNLGIRHPRIVRFTLGRRGGVDLGNPNVLHYTRNSPYVAVHLALHMGARHIGVIGVDFTDDHFFGQTGRHSLAAEIGQINVEYQRLCEAARALGVEIWNLSPESRVTSLPKIGYDAFASLATPRRPLLPGAGNGSHAVDGGDGRPAPAAIVPAPPSVHGIGRPRAGRSAQAASIIVPHGGVDRLEELATVLAQLRRVTTPHEVVVVEMGETPHAEALAREHADHHVFVPTGEPFSPARARNRGVPFARADVLLWLDGDLLVAEDFLDKALGELESRNLDVLIPWTSIRAMSAVDSAAVMAGKRRAVDCDAVTTVLSRRGVCAGAIMARRDFVARYGGFWEGFRRSGAEGNAWLHKAQVLGHAAVTSYQDQHLHQLFHPGGGCQGSRAQIADQDYQRDIALLHRIRTIRNPRRFLQLYPPPLHFPAPWNGPRRIACTGEAECVGRALRDLFGDAVTLCAPADHPDLTLHADVAPDDAEGAALDAACRLTRLSATEAEPAPPAVAAGVPPESVTVAPVNSAEEDRLALQDDVDDVESVVFGAATDRSRQRFELAFSLLCAQLGAMMAVLDCSTDSADLGERIARLHPHITYHRAAPFAGGSFHPPLDMPDGTVDRLLCLGVLDRLDACERRSLLDAAATALKPGGLLIASCCAGTAADDELVASARPFGLELVEETAVEVGGGDDGVSRCAGKILRRAGGPPVRAAPAVVLGLLTCPGRRFASSLAAVIREASMLGRLGYAASVVVGHDGAGDAIEAGGPAEPASAVPVRYLRGARPGSSRSRNRVVDAALDAGAELILLVDASVLLPPLASYSMLCHMAGIGGRVGWLAPAACCFVAEDAVPSNVPLGIPAAAVEPCSLLESDRLALFRAAAFREGIRFDESEALDGPETASAVVDLSYQLRSRGYEGRRFGGIAIGLQHGEGHGDGAERIGAAERAYLLRKWRHDPQLFEALQHDLTRAQ